MQSYVNHSKSPATSPVSSATSVYRPCIRIGSLLQSFQDQCQRTKEIREGLFRDASCCAQCLYIDGLVPVYAKTPLYVMWVVYCLLLCHLLITCRLEILLVAHSPRMF
ncbi:hypothetical protein GDO78_007966 [Eleutherodactylus coqui]|uniref:Uncharacterized protein n=1 Tax=Eleutherodactylus coqui TaxID=57060 RepID=A0A8J6FKN0_ELECQ|nr:hypothetical protein GDO78_007966 [Eleutherodactylus coqui]